MTGIDFAEEYPEEKEQERTEVSDEGGASWKKTKAKNF